ncbi:uncharacterized protein LOC119689890 [Teleopsis dalmanni]|uniref:uncharacterized protein LOC119689890 n=1 Tax=Teleopsis dalmanni TaxID=139649 RepID=UPI0018CF7227|nr:uncharacterized protein LOC119689890 [Teleopsis dalmanni]
MISTPNKTLETSLNEKLTPVRFLDSPKTRAISSDSNFTVCKTRLDVIIKTLQDNYDKWQLAQKRGLSLCSSIEAIKTRSLSTANQAATNDHTQYPQELQTYCDKLAIITSIFHDITTNAKESIRQLRSLSKLPGSCNETFYRSWQITNFIKFAEQLYNHYVEETKVKQRVMENIAHCTTRVQLIQTCSSWEYPQHVDDFISLMFLFLKQEVNVAK